MANLICQKFLSNSKSMAFIAKFYFCVFAYNIRLSKPIKAKNLTLKNFILIIILHKMSTFI